MLIFKELTAESIKDGIKVVKSEKREKLMNNQYRKKSRQPLK